MTTKSPSPEEVHLGGLSAAYHRAHQVCHDSTAYAVEAAIQAYLAHVNEAFPDEVLRLPDSDNPCGVYFRSKQREAVYRIALGERNDE